MKLIETQPLNTDSPRMINSTKVHIDKARNDLTVFFLLAHIPLGFLLNTSNIISTMHAIITMVVGLVFALDKKPYKMIYLMGYITGAELLWRATDASIFWETGKYAITLFSILGILLHKKNSKPTIIPLIYFLLLLPSILILPIFDREAIAFSLAGPMALAFSIIYFYKLPFTQIHFKNLLLAILAPIISWGFLVLTGIVTADEIVFSSGSNFATSGGIGPNQVSSILGLGALVCFFLIMIESKKKFLQLFYGLIMVWLIVQTFLTFSRGGLWTTAGAILASSFFLLRNKKARTRYIITLTVSILLFSFFLFPTINDFTGGSLAERFKDVEPTGRIEIILSDIEVFKMYPLFGVGPLQSKPFHAIYFRYSSTHTEYSRMLAEHGIFGLFSLLLLFSLLINRLMIKTNAFNKAFIIGLVMWGFLFMAHAATRLVAPSMLIGMSFLNFTLEETFRKDKQISGYAK
jgi:hypothetical protein